MQLPKASSPGASAVAGHAAEARAAAAARRNHGCVLTGTDVHIGAEIA